MILQVPVFKEFVILHLGMISMVFKDIPLEKIEEIRINILNKYDWCYGTTITILTNTDQKMGCKIIKKKHNREVSRHT